MPNRRTATRLLLIVLLPVLAACGPNVRNLMPTPNLYANGKAKLFETLPDELESEVAEVFYLTDRANDAKPGEPVSYGSGRSNSVAFGVANGKRMHLYPTTNRNTLGSIRN